VRRAGGLPDLSCLTPDEAWSLPNAGDSIYLVASCDDNESDPLDLVVDVFAYDPAALGIQGEGIAIQVDPGHLEPDENELSVNQCAALEAYGTGDNLGSPGEANVACP